MMVGTLRHFLGQKRKASVEHTTNQDQFSRKMVDQDSRLLDLPDEVLLNIVSHCSREGLLKARLICSHLKELAEPFIFATFQVLQGDDAGQLATLILRDSRRAAWVKSLLISTKLDQEDSDDLHRFPSYLKQMRTLEDLVLETPDCNLRDSDARVSWVQLQKQYEAIFQQSSIAIPEADRLLPNLRTCTMHFVDDRLALYPLTKYSRIFLHPSLETLTLSCACTDFPNHILKDYRSYKHSTPLKSLHFEECDFDARSLEIILKFPRALQTLKLSEGTRYDAGDSRLHGDLSPAALSRALTNSVANSLTHLSLALGSEPLSFLPHLSTFAPLTPRRSLNLTALTSLTHLSVSNHTLSLLLGHTPCNHTTSDRLPPNLTHLRIFTIRFLRNGRRPTLLPPCIYKHKSAHGIPHLRSITYCYEHPAGPKDPQQAARARNALRLIGVCMQALVTQNNRLYPTYLECGVRVRVEIEVLPQGYIPPYLHSEAKPTFEVLWDSERPPVEARVHAERAREAKRPGSGGAGEGGGEGEAVRTGVLLEGMVGRQEEDDRDEIDGLSTQQLIEFEMNLEGHYF